MITVSVKIDCSVDKVWGYFTTPSNWIEWYGGVKEVVPGWKTGAKIVWTSGASSPLAKVISGKEICMSGAWMDVTYRFKSDGNVGTIVEVVESDPKGGASFTDGGAANEAKWERNLGKLKVCIENDSRIYSTSQTDKKVVKEKGDIEDTKQVLGAKNVLVPTAICDLCNNKIPTGEGYYVYSETEMGIAISDMPNNNVVIGSMLYCENCANSLFTDEIWAEAKNIVFEFDGKLNRANLRQAQRQAFAYSIAMRAKRRGLSATQSRQEAKEIAQLWWKDKQAAERQLLTQAATRPPVEIGKTVELQNRDSKARGDYIRCIAFSPDGRTLSSGTGSLDKMIYISDAATGKKIQNITGHKDGVTSVAFSPDGRTLASASEDRKIILWDAANGKKLRILAGHKDGVTRVAFSPDGRILASASEDRKIILWDTANGKKLRILAGHNNKVTSVAFSPDGSTLASGSFDKTIILWDVAGGTKKQTLAGHKGGVTSVTFSPDGRTLASASQDKTIILWDVASGTNQHTLAGHKGGVTSVTFSPDGHTLVSGSSEESWMHRSSDETVIFWDISKGKLLRVLAGYTVGVSSIAFSPDGRTLAICSSDGNVILREI